MTCRPYIRPPTEPRRVDDERHGQTALYGERDQQRNHDRLPDDWKQRLPLLSAVFAARGYALGKLNDRGWAHTTCPWCGKREMGVHGESARWRCRGCAVRGDGVSLVMSLDDVSFPAAVHTLLRMSTASAPTSPGCPF